MRAKIQITVDMEEIPEEVRGRVERIFYKAEQATSEIKEVLGDISESNPISATEKIDKIRKELSFIDAVLEDAYNILVGFTSYKSQQLQQTIKKQEIEEKNE